MSLNSNTIKNLVDRIYPKYFEMVALANSVDPDQILPVSSGYALFAIQQDFFYTHLQGMGERYLP